jgi:DNA-binding HxlR family transcriptional regulator
MVSQAVLPSVADLSAHPRGDRRPREAVLMETTESLGCPVARTAQIIGNKWTPLIVRDLADGCRRFSELERSLAGISPKTLSERLKRLEEAQVIERHCFAEVPPRVEYSLTAKGHALLPVIESMREFGKRWLPGDDCVAEISDED